MAYAMHGLLFAPFHPRNFSMKPWQSESMLNSKLLVGNGWLKRQNKRWKGFSVVFEMENSPANANTESAATKSDAISAIAGDEIRVWSADSSLMEIDTVSEAELKENGFRSTRKTKIVCTIGPASCQFDQLEALAVSGMNVARINMCHGTREWHRRVIRNVRKLNDEKGYAVAIMMDTEGSEIHMGDLGGAPSVKAEDGEVTRQATSCPKLRSAPGDLNYPSFSVVFKPRSLVLVTRRTVTNVGGAPSVYEMAVESPENVNITVQPTTLAFEKQNQKATYTVTFESKIAADHKPKGRQAFGQILWKCVKGGTQVVRSPVAIAWTVE